MHELPQLASVSAMHAPWWPHGCCPDGHRQTPLWQVEPALTEAQAMPHLPQLDASALRSAHVPSQFVCPALHVLGSTPPPPPLLPQLAPMVPSPSNVRISEARHPRRLASGGATRAP